MPRARRVPTLAPAGRREPAAVESGQLAHAHRDLDHLSGPLGIDRPTGGAWLNVADVARPSDRNPLSVVGDWYVDTGCIDCDASRQVAPGLIGVDEQGRSIFLRQPESEQDREMAWRALLVCPTRSVGNETLTRPYPALYPHDLGDRVHRLGHNARSSFGAHSYLVVRESGNLMIDSPRWTREVYGPIGELGGSAHILLTHRDDVAAAERALDDVADPRMGHERIAAPMGRGAASAWMGRGAASASMGRDATSASMGRDDGAALRPSLIHISEPTSP